MKTDYVISSLPLRYSRDHGDPRAAGPMARALAAAAAPPLPPLAPADSTQSAKSVAARARARERIKQQFIEGRLKYTAETQPRDPAGKFRRVLARLKLNLGDQATEELAKQMEEAEAAGAIGDYAKARESATNVVKLVEDVKEGDLSKGTVNNIRAGARALGKLIAYLPMPQGDPNAKIRFSDLPAPASELVRNLLKRVDDKLDAEDAVKYTAVLKNWLAGGRMLDSDEMNAELSRLLRVLA